MKLRAKKAQDWYNECEDPYKYDKQQCFEEGWKACCDYLMRSLPSVLSAMPAEKHVESIRNTEAKGCL